MARKGNNASVSRVGLVTLVTYHSTYCHVIKCPYDVMENVLFVVHTLHNQDFFKSLMSEKNKLGGASFQSKSCSLF